jgi:hypothetical protein
MILVLFLILQKARMFTNNTGNPNFPTCLLGQGAMIYYIVIDILLVGCYLPGLPVRVPQMIAVLPSERV